METPTTVVPIRLSDKETGNTLLIHMEATQIQSQPREERRGEDDGEQDVGYEAEEDIVFELPDFQLVTEAIERMGGAIKESLDRIKPNKASIEFGVEVGLESGKLTALIAKGSGKANLKITLEWGSGG